MKIAFLVIVFSSQCVLAASDCLPPYWKLPSKGENCEFVASFGSPSSALVWNCRDSDSQDSQDSLYLLSGETRIQQNEGDICFVVNSVTKQNP